MRCLPLHLLAVPLVDISIMRERAGVRKPSLHPRTRSFARVDMKTSGCAPVNEIPVNRSCLTSVDICNGLQIEQDSSVAVLNKVELYASVPKGKQW